MGIWDYHGDHPPHGDRLLALRRKVPVLTVVVDRPDHIHRWYEIVDELTDETGLATSELVPAFRATGPDLLEGGLHLSSHDVSQAWLAMKEAGTLGSRG